MSRRRTDERGMVTMYVAIFTVALLVLCGLVIDGGYVLAGRRRAIDEANGAARAGAEALASSDYRAGGDISLDPGAAEAAARDFLAAAGHTGAVTVTGQEVTVRTSFGQPTALLGIIGIRSVTVTGRGRARAVPGITTGAAP